LGFTMQDSRPIVGVFRPGEGRGAKSLKFKPIENASIVRHFEHIRVSNVDELKGSGKKLITQEVPALVPSSGRESVPPWTVTDGLVDHLRQRVRARTDGSDPDGSSV
jgi:hypothetical protein